MEQPQITYLQVEYSKTFNLGNYQNEKIGLVAKVSEGADMLQAMNKIRDDVEAAHNYRRDLNNYERAKDILRHPQDCYVREVQQAERTVKEFYEKYPFHAPGDVQTALQLEENPTSEYKDHKDDWEEKEEIDF